ncbi:MAG: molybdopterin molybdotransferase MoeA [Chthoniobacterales bacterium]|nr:molybdopterin molybdotransferase MoeA [Chthoniobacterales bacterium]
MTSETEAIAAVLARVQLLPGARVPLIESLGRFSAHDLWAQRALPPFDNSAMDGYAVQAKSCRGGARLRVIGEQPAGVDRGLTMGAAEAIRIFTGARLPAGADAVIMQEEVMREGDVIVARCDVESGEFIRRQGCDLAAGQKILAGGDQIVAQNIGLLAAQGMAEIDVGALPRVAIVSTGDELARAGAIPLPGQVFESNSVMLHALALGASAKVVMVEQAPDALEQLTETLRHGLECDALIVSGGVSVGEHDLVRPSLGALGAEIALWRVAIKPGKPFLFGRAHGCSIFGLPGNPVSAFVTFLKFVRPALRKMAGASGENLGLRAVPAQIASDLSNAGDRSHYFRGILREGQFIPSGLQESHALFGLSRANALLRLAPGDQLLRGAPVMIETWD